MNRRASRQVFVALLGAIFVCALWHEQASAQFGNNGGFSGGGSQLGGSQLGGGSNFGSGSTSSGMFGNRTVGGSSGLSAGNRTFASGGAAGGLGQQGFGQSQMQLGSLQNGSSGGVTGNARFLRNNRNGAFVGSDAADVASSLQVLGGGQNALNARTAQQNLRNNSQGRRSSQPNQGTTGRNAVPVYRVSREADFSIQPLATATVLSDRLTQRVNRSASIQAEGPIEVEVRGRIATLRGSVATDHARGLAAQLVLLEPGVDQVDNQLQVPGESESSPE